MSYSVVQGDSLWGIYKRNKAKGNTSSWDDYKKANPEFADGQMMHPGDSVSIPNETIPKNEFDEPKEKVEVKEETKKEPVEKNKMSEEKAEEAVDETKNEPVKNSEATNCPFLVEKVLGPDEITIGERAEYTIVKYSKEVTSKEKQKVKWKIEFYSNCNSKNVIRSIDDCSTVPSVFQIQDDKLIVKKVPDFWACCIAVYPYVKSATISVRQISVTCPCQKKDMLRLRKQYHDIVKHGRKYGANWAANMLEHWMQGSGEDLIIPMNLLKRYKLITNAEKKIQEKILMGIKKRVIKAIQDGEKIYYLAWEEGLSAFLTSELFYASGSSNLVGRIKAKINKNLNNISVEGVLEYHWADPYDWHIGFKAWIPGVGNINDADASKYEDAGCAKSFGMYSFWHQSFSAQYIRDDILYFDTEDIRWGDTIEGRAEVEKRGKLLAWEFHNMNALKDGNADYYVGLIEKNKKDSTSSSKERRDREERTRRNNRREERRDR